MTQTRPIIGITTRIKVLADGNTINGVDNAYINAIDDSGGVPLLIPVTQDPESLRPLLNSIDGIVFTGGEDIHPRFYGESAHEKLGHVVEARDKVELLFAREAFERTMPILGICRGLQLLNVARGGSLYQDLSSQLPASQNHRLPPCEGKPLLETTHPIKISSQSLLARILSLTEVAANSSHHQAVKALAPDLIASAWSTDGVIEALEAADYAGFFIAVQSHPERLYEQPVPAWKPLFQHFIDAASAYSDVGA